MTTLEVLSLNVSREKGTVKHPVPEITVDDLGIVGDAHAGRWHRQVSLLAQESIDRFSLRLGRPIGPGEFGENITFRGVPPHSVSPLDRFVLGRCGTGGHSDRQGVPRLGLRDLSTGRESVSCRPKGCSHACVRKGSIRRGDGGEHRPRPFRCTIITLSDRVAAGVYDDRSGPRVRELLDEFFAKRRWHYCAENRTLPDDPEQLRREIMHARQCGIDVIVTTGGTGVGPRDITPETIVPMCDKLIPGIMEHLRSQFGQNNPRARLSRAVAGVMGTTQIYALPGSVRAVEECLPEILVTLDHLVYMLHGLDVH